MAIRNNGEHLTVTRHKALAAGVGLLLIVLGLAACGSPASSSPSLRTLTTFQGTGDQDTAHFQTSGPWVLVWTCEPYVEGASAPYGLTISVKTPDSSFLGTQVVDTECDRGNTGGTVGVRATGEQWLTIGTGGSGGPWTITLEVAASDTAAAVLPTLAPIPSPSPTPAPAAASLPFTFSGQLSTVQGYSPFTASVSWHFTATCTNDPADTGAPESITVSVRQPSATTAAGFSDAQVGQALDAHCDGQVADSDSVNPGGFPAGTYDWLITTGGDWTITVQPE